MKRELLKGFSMLALILMIAFASAIVASAQSKQIYADIPFSFVVGDKTLPAGEYRVTQTSNLGSAVIVQNVAAGQAAIRLTDGIDAKSKKSHARLVFRRYGQRHFLAEIWNGSETSGRRLLTSRQERILQRELAAIHSKSELAQSTYAIVELVARAR